MKLDQAVIETVLQCHWLSSCANNADSLSDIVFTANWESVRLEARGDVTAYLSMHHPKEYNRFWNKGVAQIRKKIVPQIEPTILSRLYDLGLPEQIYPHIRFDIINIIMVLSYRPFIRSDFYEQLLRCYRSGHLPCGWSGEYPDGQLLSY